MQRRKNRKEDIKDMILVAEVELKKYIAEQSRKYFEVLTQLQIYS
jgi:hypothetical protein